MSARRQSLKLLRELADAALQSLDISRLDALLDEQQNDGDGTFTAESWGAARAVVNEVFALRAKIQAAIDHLEATEIGRRRRNP